MKTILLFTIMLFSYQIHAACKCNCDPADLSLCASSYDIDHPCNGICQPAPAPGLAPMITACPTSQVYNPITGVNEWHSNCPDYIY